MAMELAGYTNYRSIIPLVKFPLLWNAFLKKLYDSGILMQLNASFTKFWVVKGVDCFHPNVYISNYTLDNSIPTLLSISTYANNLKTEIDYIKNKEGASKVNIVAHSMGGLVSRRYIESTDFGANYNKDVNSLVMIGTPNHGTFLANALAEVVEKIVHLPLPSQCALEMKTDSPFLATLNGGVDSHNTNVQVHYSTFAGEILISKGIMTLPLPKDGVVTCLSVKLDDAENYTVEYADHSGLINDGNVCKAVKSVIMGETISGSIKTEAPYIENLDTPIIGGINFVKSLILEFNCPVNVTIKDQYGRIINNQGVNQIPDASVDVIGEEKTFILPSDLAYTIYVEAYSDGSFSLDGLYFNSSTIIPAIAFENIAIGSSTKVESSIIQPNSTDFVLNVDSDGNGTFDYQKEPDIVGEVLRRPAPPENLSASFSSSSVTLSWTASQQGTSSIAGYSIYRGRISTGESPVPIATVPANTTTYTDTQITIGETYYYYVEAFDNQSPSNYSDPSNEASVNTGTYTITATACFGGSITPSGSVTVNYGDSKTFTIKADPKFMIARVLVDGSPIRITNPITMTYTFSNVISNHTISAEFVLIPDTTPPTLILPTISGVDLNLPNATITTNQSTFTFTVSATDDSGVISRMVVKVNGVVQIDKNNLDPTIYLSEGANTVEVTVYDPSGNYTTKSFKVTVDTKPPVIDVTLPETVSSQELTVKGTAFDQVTGIQSLTVNGNPVIPTLEGNFETKLTLSSGANTITIEAVDKVGNKSTKSFTVSYVQPQPRQSYMVVLKIGDPTITVNGTSKKIDAQGSKPIIKNGRTLLPIRTLIESLGGTVEWNAKEQKVTITLNGHSMILWIGKTTALVDSSKAPLDVAPQIINGRTYIPLRFVSEHLGASVNWDDKTQTITIYYWP
ncbi:stalk domain-containing protein [Caldisericum sp.]|uniref:stalk domain-containing protein n=1 Tax=Caldisericum sp. TaxID=2499687 RepID=UPI003D0AD327